MNIFYLDEDIEKCAQYHCDKHVVKMILEYAQILCTVLHQQGQPAPYKSTHQHHPCVIWAGASLDNWLWLRELLFSLNAEFQYRFDHEKGHQSFYIAKDLVLPQVASFGITERPQTMPEKFIIPHQPIKAYRRFYSVEKKHLLKYTKRGMPPWLVD